MVKTNNNIDKIIVIVDNITLYLDNRKDFQVN